MALTVATAGGVDLSKPSPQPNYLGSKSVFAQITFDSSYPTGGEEIAASDLGLNELWGLNVVAQDEEEYWFSYDNANGKIAVFDVDSEVANATDLSGLVVQVIAFGR